MSLQTMHDIIGYPVAFFFREFLTKSAHEFACAPQRECDSEAQHVPAGAHPGMRTKREHICQWRRFNATIRPDCPI